MFVLIAYKFYDRISWSKNDKTLFKLEIRKSRRTLGESNVKS